MRIAYPLPMNLTQLANPRILDQPIYTPGKPIEKVAEQFGLAAHEIVKLASNENPWGASPYAIEAGKEAFKNIHLYPEGSGLVLRNTICKILDLEPSQIILFVFLIFVVTAIINFIMCVIYLFISIINLLFLIVCFDF